jgi:hypothetical protein
LTEQHRLLGHLTAKHWQLPDLESIQPMDLSKLLGYGMLTQASWSLLSSNVLERSPNTCLDNYYPSEISSNAVARVIEPPRFVL